MVAKGDSGCLAVLHDFQQITLLTVIGLTSVCSAWADDHRWRR